MDADASSHVRPVLVVEDDPGIGRMMDLALAGRGLRIHHAATVAEALEVAAGVGPGLVLLDVRLRDHDGLAFVDSFPGRLACQVVVMTASEDAAAAALRSGADDFLAKPFSLDTLYAIVDRYVASEAWRS